VRSDMREKKDCALERLRLRVQKEAAHDEKVFRIGAAESPCIVHRTCLERI
jgi:hypothetical protein